MESSYKKDSLDNINSYDKEAEASNWFGPEIVFGLSYKYIQAGEKIIDIGIGTGLCSVHYHRAGLRISGIDISDEMIDVSRKKMPDAQLIKHDLLIEPYPFETESMNHAVCTGVMHFFKDLNNIFREVSRILRPDGIFGFVTADLKPGEENEIKVGPEHTGSGFPVIMYRHGENRIEEMAEEYGFIMQRDFEFPVFMDSNKERKFTAKAYIIKKMNSQLNYRNFPGIS